MTHPDITESDRSRFWESVDRGEPSICWEWTRGRTGRGYGVFFVQGIRAYTHRVAFHLSKGIDPAGMMVCHHCDNPPCCNPDHLFLGTQTDNMRDAKTKGRTSPPPKNGEQRRRLTMGQAQKIRRRYHLGESMPTLGREFELTWASIRTILNNESYIDPAYHRARFRDSRRRKNH